MDEFSRNDSSLQVSQLVKKEGEGFLIARVFFDFDGVQDANANEINYNKVYIQPGVVTLPFPIEKDQPDFNSLRKSISVFVYSIQHECFAFSII